MIPLQGAGVQSPLGELRSHKLHSTVKNKQKRCARTDQLPALPQRSSISQLLKAKMCASLYLLYIILSANVQFILKDPCCAILCLAVSDSLQPHGLHSPWNSPGQNTGVGSLSLLQGIFPTQGLNPGLLHCRRILYCLNHQRNPEMP